jgi:hypothetical protein
LSKVIGKLITATALLIFVFAALGGLIFGLGQIKLIPAYSSWASASVKVAGTAYDGTAYLLGFLNPFQTSERPAPEPPADTHRRDIVVPGAEVPYSPDLRDQLNSGLIPSR